MLKEKYLKRKKASDFNCTWIAVSVFYHQGMLFQWLFSALSLKLQRDLQVNEQFLADASPGFQHMAHICIEQTGVHVTEKVLC